MPLAGNCTIIETRRPQHSRGWSPLQEDIDMALRLILPNGNLINPQRIEGVVKFPGKGVALRNEFNKILDFLREPDERRQRIIIEVLHRVMSTRNWEQPDWDSEFATAP